MSTLLLRGDVRQTLAAIKDESVQCVVTSPPYWGLRDYKTETQVWGRREGGREQVTCLHEWGNHQTGRVTGGGNRGAQTKWPDGPVPDNPSIRAWCGRCGAWRGSLGLEPMPELYVEHLVMVFQDVRRVLRKTGTLWLNLGDSYASGKGTCYNPGGNTSSFNVHLKAQNVHPLDRGNKSTLAASGLKPKDLVGIPWMVAFALRADGWWLRSDIIWAKANCMPESVRDRPTRSHEYLFLLTKSASYYYDADAIKEPCLYDVDGTGTVARKARQRAGIRPVRLKDARAFDGKNGDKQRGHSRRHDGFNDRWDLMEKKEQCSGYRNKRDVWTVSPAQYPYAHFAMFPEKLVEPCILASSRAGDIVYDPFAGSGTTLFVSQQLGRKAIGSELNPEYCRMVAARLHEQTIGLPL